MTLIEKLALKLTEEQRERFFDLIEQQPDVSPHQLYRQVVRPEEE